MRASPTLWLRRGLEYLLWLAVLLLPAEAFVRLTGHGASLRLEVHESGLFQVPKPGSRIVHRAEGFSAYRFNANGLRGAPLPPTPAPGELRVAFLGDSYTEASQVADEAIFLRRFAQGMATAGRPITTLNFGLSGESLPTEVLRYRHLVRPRKPHVVVLVSSDGDLRDILRATGEKAVAQWRDGTFHLEPARLEWRRTPAEFARRAWLRDHFESYVLLQRAATLKRQTMRRLDQWFADAEAPVAPVDAELRTTITIEPAMEQVYAEILGALKAEVAADGAVLVGVHIPKGFAVRDDAPNVAEAYARIYQAAGVPLVTTLADLRTAFEARTWTHFGHPEDTGAHPTPAGHGIIGAAMTRSALEGAWAPAFVKKEAD